MMKIRLGPDEGNSGALIRWGKYLDNGIWLIVWKFRKTWGFDIRKGYLKLGIFTIMYGN